MRIHIVAPEREGDWVITRLARHLVERNGWTWDKDPHRKAVVNIWFPYLAWRFTQYTETLTAAWFTHKRANQWGRKVWRYTAEALSLRVTPAALYVPDLERYGRTAHIPHPVELDLFTPDGREKTPSAEFQIGVSGTVYRDGRKGEDLVERLVKEKWKVKASGKGWPCPTKWYEWEQLPAFYRSLDCFLCSSTVEGGPVTVLEALACGVPVVIPHNTGQCDEYPEMPGIRHYVPFEYEDMERALCTIFEERGRVDPRDLRAVAAEYTIPRYCQEWRDAIYGLIGGTDV